jgi:translation initiation factor IF-1
LVRNRKHQVHMRLGDIILLLLRQPVP